MMSADAEKLISDAMDVFFTRLSEGRVIKLEGMEDHVKVPQYKALIGLVQKHAQLEADAVCRILDSKADYLRALQQLRMSEQRWLDEVQSGMKSLEERDVAVKEINSNMRRRDFSVLQQQPSTAAAAATTESLPKAQAVLAKAPLKELPPKSARPAVSPFKAAKPDLLDIRKRLAMISTDDTPGGNRVPLQPITNKKASSSSSKHTPKCDAPLSSKGSFDGSLVANRAPIVPMRMEEWNVPAPNFDDTVDGEESEEAPPAPATAHAFLQPSLPAGRVLLMEGRHEEEEEEEHTFELPRPSLPYQTPTVPLSRPFLLSSLREKDQQLQQSTRPIRPVLSTPTVPSSTTTSSYPTRPVPTPVANQPSGDNLSDLGLMRLKRPVLTSQTGKRLMGEL